MADDEQTGVEAAAPSAPEAPSGLTPAIDPEDTVANITAPLASGSFSAHTLDTIARMLVIGRPQPVIAATVGRSVESIKKLVQRNPEELSERIDAARAVMDRGMVLHHYEMMAALPEARQAVFGGLRSVDETTRIATGKWLIDNVVPRQPQRIEADLNFSGGVDLSSLLGDLTGSLRDLAEARRGAPSGLSRVRSGPEALPRPVVAPEPEPPPPAEPLPPAEAEFSG